MLRADGEAGLVAPGDAARRPAGPPLLLAAGAVLVPAIAIGLTFTDRPDYLGHYLAGAGGALLLLAAAALAGLRPWVVVGIVVAAILVGVGTESTVFRLAIFDPVDFATQSIGAAIAGCAYVGVRGSAPIAAGTAVLAAAFLAAGFDYAFA